MIVATRSSNLAGKPAGWIRRMSPAFEDAESRTDWREMVPMVSRASGGDLVSGCVG